LIADKQAQLAKSQRELILAEHALRSDSDVAAALAGISQAASNLENECVQRVEGFRELLNEKAQLDAKVASVVPDAANTNGAEATAIAESLKRLDVLAADIGERRRQAAIKIPEVAAAYRVLVEQGKNLSAGVGG